MKNTLQRGFTLIELLVVITIIGILAAVVLGQLGDVREGAHDVSAQSSINDTRKIAELYYSENDFSYGTTNQAVGYNDESLNESGGSICTDERMVPLLVSAAQQTQEAVQCYTEGNEYAVQTRLRTGQVYCVDSTGFAGKIGTQTNTISDTDMECGS